MTSPKPDEQTQYIALLEGVVAVLAVKAGYNVKALMVSAITDITKQSGMETTATDDLIARRWAGRDLTTSILAASMATVNPEADPLVAPQTIEPVNMSTRLQEYKERKALAATDSVSEAPTQT